jgi:short-subunit dehydrogenase
MKRIVIVGATSGIGMELARLFLQNDYQVGIAGRRKDRLDCAYLFGNQTNAMHLY